VGLVKEILRVLAGFLCVEVNCKDKMQSEFTFCLYRNHFDCYNW